MSPKDPKSSPPDDILSRFLPDGRSIGDLPTELIDELQGLQYPSREVINRRFEIIEELGFGGMGTVYKVKDLLMVEQVKALKFILRSLVSHETNRKRFIQEAQIAQSLRHEGIVTVSDIGEHEDRLFLTMEFLEGQSLSAYLKSKGGVLGFLESSDIILKVCEALSYAHHKNVIHRDIKPQNIFILPDGQVKLLDFGLAKLISPGRLTRSSIGLGTAYYMSPEQSLGREVDSRSDIFALGVVFYQMLVGQVPMGRFKLPSERQKDIPFFIDPIIEKCLDEQPVERYGDIGLLDAEIKKAQEKFLKQEEEKKRLEEARLKEEAEQKKREEERRQKESEETEKRRQVEERQRKEAEEKARRVAEEAERKKKEEEKNRLEEEKQKEEERRKAEELKRQEEERLKRKAEEEERKKAEQLKREAQEAEQKRLVEEERKKEEEDEKKRIQETKFRRKKEEEKKRAQKVEGEHYILKAISFIVLIVVVIALMFKCEELSKVGRNISEPVDPEGNQKISLINIKKYFKENQKMGRLFIVEGEINNGYPEIRQMIKLRGSLKSAENRVALIREVYAGWILTPKELETCSFEEINRLVTAQPERFSPSILVLPGKTIPFMILFPPLPPGSTEVSIKVVSSQKVNQEELPPVPPIAEQRVPEAAPAPTPEKR